MSIVATDVVEQTFQLFKRVPPEKRLPRRKRSMYQTRVRVDLDAVAKALMQTAIKNGGSVEMLGGAIKVDVAEQTGW